MTMVMKLLVVHLLLLKKELLIVITVLFTHNGAPTLTDNTLSNNTELPVSQFSGVQVVAGASLKSKQEIL